MNLSQIAACACIYFEELDYIDYRFTGFPLFHGEQTKGLFKIADNFKSSTSVIPHSILP